MASKPGFRSSAIATRQLGRGECVLDRDRFCNNLFELMDTKLCKSTTVTSAEMDITTIASDHKPSYHGPTGNTRG